MPLSEIVPYIDWTPFFHAWELRGIYPKIFQQEGVGPKAKELFDDGQKLLDKIVREKLLEARAVIGFYPANSVGEDIEVYADESRHLLTTFHTLRQQQVKGNQEPNRLAEGLAELMHKKARTEWGFGKDENLSHEDLTRERYRGIRPAPGYPALPDHTEKRPLFDLLCAEMNTGINLTENFAMYPAASVSGFYFSHPESKYFAVGKIDRGQIEDYSRRKGMDLRIVERWLSPNLNYDPDAS